jgi:hypothetical protein
VEVGRNVVAAGDGGLEVSLVARAHMRTRNILVFEWRSFRRLQVLLKVGWSRAHLLVRLRRDDDLLELLLFLSVLLDQLVDDLVLRLLVAAHFSDSYSVGLAGVCRRPETERDLLRGEGVPVDGLGGLAALLVDGCGHGDALVVQQLQFLLFDFLVDNDVAIGTLCLLEDLIGMFLLRDDYLVEFALVKLLNHVVRASGELVVVGVALAGAEHETEVLDLLGHHVLQAG